MSVHDVIRAWKDADYRESLSEVERARLPQHPAGLVELSDADLGNVAGGYTYSCTPSFRQCNTALPFDCTFDPFFCGSVDCTNASPPYCQ